MARQNPAGVDISTLTGDEQDKDSYRAFRAALGKTDVYLPDTALFRTGAKADTHIAYVKKRPNEDEYPELCAFYDAARSW